MVSPGSPSVFLIYADSWKAERGNKAGRETQEGKLVEVDPRASSDRNHSRGGKLNHCSTSGDTILIERLTYRRTQKVRVVLKPQKNAYPISLR